MFTRKTVSFLKELAENNNRPWFDQRKQVYEDQVRSPALAYIEAMAQPLAKISPHFVASPKKTGGSLMRVYRDTRFGKDKTPYKTNIGIHFRHTRAKDVHAPGFYLHIEPGEVFIGAGIWRPESSTLHAVRKLIDDNPGEWNSLCKRLCTKNQFEFGGDSLKRPPRGYSEDHPCITDLKRKDFIAVRHIAMSSITSKTVVADTARLFKAAAPLVKFICDADDLEF